MKNMKTCCKGYKVMVELVKKELIYDIKNTAFIFADSYSSYITSYLVGLFLA